VTQKLLKSMVSKWLPIVGAIAMAAWARFSTKRLGEQARGILSQDLEFEGELDEEDVPTTDVAYEPPTSRQTELRIRILINLMRIDRQIRDEELEFIEGVIAEANLPSEVADALRAGMSGAACAPIPYEEFGQHPEESLALLVDMVALARRDGEYHPAERAYVRQVGERFGLHGDDLEALLGEG